MTKDLEEQFDKIEQYIAENKLTQAYLLMSAVYADFLKRKEAGEFPPEVALEYQARADVINETISEPEESGFDIDDDNF